MTSSHYTVVQYVPDPVADERINIGVIAFDERSVRASFLDDWSRVLRFGREDITFLRDFARHISEAVKLNKLGPDFFARREPLSGAEVERMAAAWMNSIQFTPPRASLKAPDALLRESVERFLVVPERRSRGYRGRWGASALARSGVRKAVEQVFGDALAVESVLRERHTLAGALDRHTFDVVVGNGIPYLAAHGLSFETPDYRGLLKRTLDATAWAIDDVKSQRPELPIAVVALQPIKSDTEAYAHALETYERARKVFEGLDAKVVAEDSVEGWALPIVQKIAPARPS